MNQNTPTPRTDALKGTPMTRSDSDDFARTLERELAEAKMAQEHLEGYYQQMIREILEYEPIPAVSNPDGHLEAPWQVIARTRNERDQLRAEITTLASEDTLPEGASNNALIVQERLLGLRTQLEATQVATVAREATMDKEITGLRARVADFTADKDRLDELLKQCAEVNKMHYGNFYLPETRGGVDAALDSARAKT